MAAEKEGETHGETVASELDEAESSDSPRIKFGLPLMREDEEILVVIMAYMSTKH